MKTFPLEALLDMQRVPRSPLALSNDAWDVLTRSVCARATLEDFDPETGDYRVVLEGRLEPEREPVGRII